MSVFWVLIVTVAIAGQPVQKIAVSGLSSNQACAARGESMIKTPLSPQSAQEAGKPYKINYECVRGVAA